MQSPDGITDEVGDAMKSWVRGRAFHFQALFAGIVCASAVVIAAPNAFSTKTLEGWPDWLPSRRIQLGIDFTGGVELLMTPEWREVYTDALEGLRNRLRTALRDQNIRYHDLITAQGSLRLQLLDRTKLGDLRDIALSESRALGLSPTSWMPGIALRPSANGSVTIFVTAIGRAALHDQAIRLSMSWIDRGMKCLGVPDYRLARDGDRIWLVVRSWGEIHAYQSPFKPC